MKWFLFLTALFAVLGCSDLQQAMDEAQREDVAEPPGIAPAEMVGDPMNANDPKPANPNPPPARPPKEGIVGKTTAKVVDYHKATAENPNLIEVKNEIRGNDPITVAGSAYISMSSRVSAASFQHQINLMRELNDGKWPTYEEYQAEAKKHNIRFSELPAYQMYGYDDQTGRVMILEDPQKKKEIYEAAGIPQD